MKKNKSEIYLAIFIIVVIIGTTFLYFQTQEKNATGIFPEKLGDMNIAFYREGDVAMKIIKELHGNSPGMTITNAYVANYRNSSGSKTKFWVSEPADNKDASTLVVSMNRMVGKTGVFSNSTPMNIEGITVYFVSGSTPDLGLYHYFYAKGNRVFWIQVDNPDESYRIDIVKESIKRI